MAHKKNKNWFAGAMNCSIDDFICRSVELSACQKGNLCGGWICNSKEVKLIFVAAYPFKVLNAQPTYSILFVHS